MRDNVYLVIFDGDTLVNIIDHTGYEQKAVFATLSNQPMPYMSGLQRQLSALQHPEIYAIETALEKHEIPLDEVRRCGERLI